MAGRVTILRLITGEEILTEVIGASSSFITIKNPVRIIVIPNKTDPKNPQIALAPFAEFALKQEFEVQSEHILLDYEPVKEFTEQYKGMFGGIITSPKKLILPS